MPKPEGSAKVECGADDCNNQFKTQKHNVGLGGTPLCPGCRPGPSFPWEEDDG